MNHRKGINRRDFNRLLLLSAGTLTLGAPLQSAFAQTGRSLRIGIIGAGNIGGAIGSLWAAAGHEILFSSRNPDELAPLVEEAGENTRAGYPQEAAEFGEVVFLALPYSAMPQIGNDYGSLLQGKVVIDCSNPSVNRDGDMAADAVAKGSGVATQEYLPGTRVVRAFGTINFRFALANAHREGDRIAIPIAGDDAEAVQITSNLVIDAGFEPVLVGGLETSRLFDIGTSGSGTNTTAAELRRILEL